MRKRRVMFVGSLMVVAVLGAAAWYLGSPLFINRTVDEAFPFEAPNQAEVAEMSEAELKQMEAEFVAALPNEAELARMSEAERKTVQDRVMRAAVVMPDHMMEEPMPVEAGASADQPQAVRQGQFKDADSFHKGSGMASIYQLPDGAHVLRLESFMVTNGPDLHVLLATNPMPTGHADLGEYIDLGSLKGNLGSQNYTLPAGADPSQYGSVVIYCLPFRVVFATAALGS
jgi:hypothetical protein